MARWTGIADWIGPTVNEGDGDGIPLEADDAISTVVGAVLHIQEGTEAGTESWQRNPRSRVSSHFLLPKVGRPRQMVDTHDRAWCQVAGNRHWLSLECEGRTGQALTADQLAGAAAILARAHRDHEVPLQLATNPNAVAPSDGGGLGYHALGGAAWGGHFDCPGQPIINQRPAIIVGAQQILGGGDMPLSNDDVMKVWTWDLLDGPGADPAYQVLNRVDAGVQALAGRPALTLTDAQVTALGAQLATALLAGLRPLLEGAHLALPPEAR